MFKLNRIYAFPLRFDTFPFYQSSISNERLSYTIGAINLPRLARSLLTVIGSCRIYDLFKIKARF